MPSTLPPSMSEALRLTREGKLTEATALLRGGAGGAEVKTPVSEDGLALTRYEGPAGTRDYRLFAPETARPGAPLIVMLHGCTQDAGGFARGTRMNSLAEAKGAVVLYPEQSRQENPQGCWNWFQAAHQEARSGEAAILMGMIEQVAAAHGTGPVFVAGLSAGGAMAAILAELFPERIEGIFVHSGLAAGAARDLPSALAAMQQGGQDGPAAATPVPTLIFHGDADETVHPSNAERLAARASGGARLTITEEEVFERGGRRCRVVTERAPEGRMLSERWTIIGAGHAWQGGDASGSHTDARGPDASAEAMRFFFDL